MRFVAPPFLPTKFGYSLVKCKGCLLLGVALGRGRLGGGEVVICLSISEVFQRLGETHVKVGSCSLIEVLCWSIVSHGIIYQLYVIYVSPFFEAVLTRVLGSI